MRRRQPLQRSQRSTHKNELEMPGTESSLTSVMWSNAKYSLIQSECLMSNKLKIN